MSGDPTINACCVPFPESTWCGGTVVTTLIPPAPKPDMVDAPEHYTRLNPQPLEVIAAWDLDFETGSAVKYIARAGHKPGSDAVTDYRKAISFLQHKIKRLESK